VNWNDASTSCERTREAIADAVISRRADIGGDDVARHIASCAACRAYRAECEVLWADLGKLRVPAPTPGARTRFDAALWSQPLPAPTRFPPIFRYAALAASLVVAALVGFSTASLRDRSSATRVATATDSVPQFLLLLYDEVTAGPPPAPERIAAIVAEYTAWANTLAAQGQLVSAEKLSDAPSDWLGGAVATRNGERIGGFFLIRARDLAEARRIAGQCPHLKYGGRIELRPIEST
jgi:hypothetical protein